jgi:pentapeptide MXKDX repeat protein
MTIDFSKLTGPQLVDYYNHIAIEIGLPEVKRFSTKEDGAKRCQDVFNKLKEHTATQSEEVDVTITDTIREAKEDSLLDHLSEDPQEAKAQLQAEFGDEPAQDEVSQDEVSQDEVSQDEVSQDEVSQDEVSQDEVSQDEVSQDEVSQDEVSQDEVSQDEVSQDEFADAELHDEFGSPDLPPPQKAPKAKTSKAKTSKGKVPKGKAKTPKAQVEAEGDLVQLDLFDANTVVQAIGPRSGTNKENLTLLLVNEMGTMIPVDELISSVYGSPDKGTESSLLMVLKGVEVAIQKKLLPLQVRKERVNKKLHVGLFALPSQEPVRVEEDHFPQDQEESLASPEAPE